MSSRVFDMWIPVVLYVCSVQLSLFMWLGNVAFSKFWRSDYDEESVISPTRWLFSTFAPLALMTIALRRKSVNKSGAALGLVFAFILSIASHAFFASLIAFFFSSSRATKFRGHMKRKFEKDFKEGEGLRNWVKVLCNGGMATHLAILYLIDCGSGERPIDFVKDYRSSWLGIAILSSFACCNGDTWASELGSVLSKGDPFLITNGRRVPRGTNGGVSISGLILSLLGGTFVGLFYYLVTVYMTEYNLLANSPPQWPIIAIASLAGLYGSVLDSMLGAICQYSGIDEDGKIVESPSSGVTHINGLRILDNNSVNLIASILTGITVPFIALKFWPES